MLHNSYTKVHSVFIAILFIFWFGSLQAEYYVSPLGDDTADGSSPSTAWATIGRVNRAMSEKNGGATVLFKCGGIYTGSIQLSDTKGPVTLGAYGKGDAPVISGAQRVTKWKAVNDSLWIAQVPNRPRSIDVLYVNGRKYYPARYPNKGYLNTTNKHYNGLKDKNLGFKDFPDGHWNGATVAFKTVLYTINRDTVSNSYADGRIDMVKTRGADAPESGWGYFFQNHMSALDTIGEWVYDKKESLIYLYTHDNPNNQIIEFSDLNYAIEMRNSHREYPFNNCHVVVENLCFQHYRQYAFYARYGQYMTIRNNVIRNCTSALCISDFEHLEIHDNIIEDIEINGFEFWGGVNQSQIHHNTFRRIGISLDGGQDGHSAIAITVGYALKENKIYMNRFDRIGCCAINAANMQNLIISNNVISNTMLCMADGGAIYVVKPAQQKNNEITGNIIYNTLGNNEGTPEKNERVWRYGIYLDDGIDGVKVQENTVYNSGGGIFMHGSSNIVVSGNVLYNNEIANIVVQKVEFNQLAENYIENNYMHSDASLMYLLDIDSSIEGFSELNTINNNYISGPVKTPFAIIPGKEVDKGGWLSVGFDSNSVSPLVSYETSGASSYKDFTILARNPTDKAVDFKFNGTYITFGGTVYNSSIHLKPFESVILFKYPFEKGSLQAPVGSTNLCAGASSVYQVPASVNLTNAAKITWQIIPELSGTIINTSGVKGSVVTIQWHANYTSSPVQLIYNMQVNEASLDSKALLISLKLVNDRPPTPTGPIQIAEGTTSSVFEGENPQGVEIEWFIPEGVGTIDYDTHGNSVKVKWAQNLLGTYSITYRIKNSCDVWTDKAFPLSYNFPVAAPKGPDKLCEGVRTKFTAPTYIDLKGKLFWALSPHDVGTITFENNEAWVTLHKDVTSGKSIKLYYTGLNNNAKQFRSSDLTLTITPLPGKPAAPAGPVSIPWNAPSTDYTAGAGKYSYEWLIVPGNAGTITANGNKATVHWNGGTDHSYTGQALISYRIKDINNACGFSNFSPSLSVSLLPKPPVTTNTNPCSGSNTVFTARNYENARTYTWNISPAAAASTTSKTNSATINWSSGYKGGEVSVSYSVTDVSGKVYTSPTVKVNVYASQKTPGIATGLGSVAWDIPSSRYRADASPETDDNGYQWFVAPPAAGTISPSENKSTVTIKWNHQYVGLANVSYKTHNACGFSGLSPSLPVSLLPEPPTTTGTNPCSGSNTVFTARKYETAVAYIWNISPVAAASTTSKTNTATINWSSEYKGGEASVSYSVTDVSGKSYTSPTVTVKVNTHASQKTPGIATGLGSVAWDIPSSRYRADASSETDDNGYQWFVTPAAGTISPSENRSTVTIKWNHQYVGLANVSYKTHNVCGFSASSPSFSVSLLPEPPTTTNTNPCSGSNTVFTARNYENARTYIWNISPAEAASTTSKTNSATINWSSGYKGGEVSVSYSVTDVSGKAYTSPTVKIKVHASQKMPGMAAGSSSVAWNIPSSRYRADASSETDDNGYQWFVTPPAAGTISPTENKSTVTIKWNHQYVGIANVSYKTHSSCGWSNEAPPFHVTLLPEPPVLVQDIIACSGGETSISARKYQNSLLYQWFISPTDAGRISDAKDKATIHWNNNYTGEAQLFYRVTNAAQEVYTASPVVLTVKGAPTAPASAIGQDKISHNNSLETYHTALRGLQYEWTITPSDAADIPDLYSEAIAVKWNASHHGTAVLKYRVRNECDWSDLSDPLNIEVVTPVTSVPFSLEEIPEIFTPNGDGINDTWEITALEQNPDAVIRIFNRAKKLLVEFKAAQLPWNGHDANGTLLESGNYLYLIDTRKDKKQIAGFVTILR